jgi:hypothetical protein
VSLAVSFADHSERINEILQRKIKAGMGASAVSLAEAYKDGLQAEQAPPHSEPGQVPHAYLGHRPGGYGPLLGENEIQNVTFFGFSRDQSDNLSSYIEGGSSGSGSTVQGSVGFTDSHVTTRSQNYLIGWDQGTVPRFSGIVRPWIIPLYRKAKSVMISAFADKFRDTK